MMPLCRLLCAVFSCALSVLATQSIPAHLASATLANSMTLHLGDWLSLPAIPLVVSFLSAYCTVYNVWLASRLQLALINVVQGSGC